MEAEKLAKQDTRVFLSKNGNVVRSTRAFYLCVYGEEDVKRNKGFIFMKMCPKNVCFIVKSGRREKKKGAEERKVVRKKVSHYNTQLVDHFLASKSKPTISIWKILGSHLSSCVVKQREGANYE